MSKRRDYLINNPLVPGDDGRSCLAYKAFNLVACDWPGQKRINDRTIFSKEFCDRLKQYPYLEPCLEMWMYVSLTSPLASRLSPLATMQFNIYKKK